MNKMEDTAYEWESIKKMTDTILIENEIVRIENERRRLLKRLDYLNICKNQICQNELYQNK
jgi:regulator of replication initiation timing